VECYVLSKYDNTYTCPWLLCKIKIVIGIICVDIVEVTRIRDKTVSSTYTNILKYHIQGMPTNIILQVFIKQYLRPLRFEQHFDMHNKEHATCWVDIFIFSIILLSLLIRYVYLINDYIIIVLYLYFVYIRIDWLIDFWCLTNLTIFGVSAIFQLYHGASFSGGRSRSTRREPPTMSKQLVNFITCAVSRVHPFL
jgi:hypothetical protein